MGKILYLFFTTLYPIAVKIASLFNPKARLWIKGRENIFARMRETISREDRIIWMHCSSLGEFEQGRPVLEKLKSIYPSHKILLTFFSPSGYEVRKDYNGADYIFYLPTDSRSNAINFYNIVNPKLIIFVKYEFWYHYLLEAKKRNTPLLLISAIFRKSQPFFSKYGHFHRSMLSCFTHFFVQNSESVSLLETIGLTKNVTLSGDTRFDRVIEIAENVQPNSLIENFCKGAEVVVAGSTWLEDDKELSHFVNSRKSVKFIIAPHDIGKSRLEDCRRLYKNPTFYSSFSESKDANINILIIDNVGMLSSLYKYATICYIGGGFGEDGVHNVLEAAVYGKPVVFGPEYEKFNEAIELLECGGGISIENALELEAAFSNLLSNSCDYNASAAASTDYVYSKQGATQKILQFIQENRLLTN